MKRVMLFLPAFESGGVERNAVILGNSLVSRGYKVSVIYSRSTGHWLDRFDKNITIERIPKSMNTSAINQRIADAILMLIHGPKIIARHNENNDLVILSFQSNIVAIVLGISLGVPVAVRLSNHFSSSAIEKSLLRSASEALKKLFYKYADSIIANSTELAKDYAPILGKDVLVIHNPIDIDMAEGYYLLRTERGRSLEQSPHVLITVGRLAKQKNHLLMLRAMKLVLETLDCILIIVGEGGERTKIENEIDHLNLGKTVRLVGHQQNPFEYMVSADLFVLSSDYEGFPNVLIEAIACGLPVVSTDCKTGPREILANGKAGYLCECNSPIALANTIINAIQNKGETQKKALRARKRLEVYRTNLIINKYEDVVSTLTKKTK